MFTHKIQLFCLFIICSNTQAITYCVDPDVAGGTGCNIVVQTINQVNALSLSAGDQVLFKRGYRWTGEKLLLTASGAPGNEIVYGAYGTGAAPIIEGFTDTSALPYSWVKATQLSADLSALYQETVQIWRLSSNTPGWSPNEFVYWASVLETTVNGAPVLTRLRFRDRACHNGAIYQQPFDQNYDYSFSSGCPDNANRHFWVRLDEGSPSINNRKIYMVESESGPLIDTNEQQYVVIRDLGIRGSAGSHAMPAIVLRNSSNVLIQNNDISFSKVAMSTREVLKRNLNIVGHYRLDGKAGANENKIFDSSRARNPGTVIGGAIWDEGRDGQPALRFDGVNDYVDFDLANEAAFDPTTGITVMGWFNHDSTGGAGTTGIQKHQSYHLATIETDQANSRYQFRVVDSVGGIHNIYTPFLPNDTWHHIAGTYDGAELKIYVDGAQAASPVAWAGGIADSANAFEIGRRNTFRYYKGMIDDVYVSNRALTENEIYQLSRAPNYFSNSEIRGNKIHDNYESGIELAGLSSYNTIVDNDVFENWNLGEKIGDRVGIELTQYQPYFSASRKVGNIIEANRVYSNGTEGITRDASIAVFGGKDTQVRYNDIYDNAQSAFYFAWSEDSTFHYNVIRGNRTVNGRHLALIGNFNLRLYNNTIVNNTLSATVENIPYGSWRLISIDGPTFAGGEIKNNIIAYNRMYSDMPENPTALMMVWPLASTIDHNLYFDNQSFVAGVPQALWFTSPVNNAWYVDFDDWKNRSGYDQSGIEANPSFVDAVSNNFNLTFDSPAIDAGLNLGLSLDFINNPVIALPDLGAIENQDRDNDGLTYTEEVALGTDPANPDSDNDLISDGDEINVYFTNPLNLDSDSDGFRDGTEVANASDPLDSASVPQLLATGDVNFDGTINVADLLLMQRHVLGLYTLNPEQIAYGDFYPATGDGVITLSDLLLIIKLAFL